MATRRTFLGQSLGLTLALINLPSILAVTSKSSTDDQPAWPERLYRDAIVIDTAVNEGPDFNVQQALDAGLTACVCDLPIYPRNLPNALQAMGSWNAAFNAADSQFVKVLKAADLQSAKQRKKFGVIIACQDASILDTSTISVNDYNLQNLKQFHDLGMRVLTLTHNERNAVGDSFREKTNAGLSRLGERVVVTMNELGMIVDLSHCGDKTTAEAIQLSKKPCSVTHAGCRALYPTLRNKSDDQIRALAEKGGVFGVYNMSLWLTDRKTSSIDDVIEHIDHAVKVGGIDHVSFGSDGPVLENMVPEAEQLEGMQGYARRNLGMPGAEKIPNHAYVQELNTPRRLSRLADALSRRGYKSSAIEKVIGANFARLFQEVCG